MRRGLAFLLLLWASAAWAGLRVDGVAPVSLGALEATGQVSDPRASPDGRYLGFQLLGAGGDTLEVFLAPLDVRGFPPSLGAAEPVLPAPAPDPFRLGKAGRPVTEDLSWGPAKRGRPRVAVAATRLAVSRGASQVNFDVYLSEPGRRRFVTDSPENDAQPAFSPDGEYLAFASGRTGQGDLYLYHFFAEGSPLIQVTYEAGGSEMYPAWDPAGRRLAFTGHLGGEDHVFVVDDVRALAAEPDEAKRRTLARRLTRDLTPGWAVSCLAPSFSPDGRWVAFYAREGSGERADLYVVPVEGGEPRRLLEKGLPETRGGPRWSPRWDGLFAVIDDAGRMNPLVWLGLGAQDRPAEVSTGTQLNADPYPLEAGGGLVLLFTAQGGAEREQKRWRRIYAARLTREGAE